MKKYFYLVLALLLLSPMVAMAQLRVDIDNIDNVEFDLYDVTPSYTYEDGKYVVDMAGETNLRVIAKKDVLFTEVTLVDEYFQEETSWSDYVDVLPDGRFYIDIRSSFPEDEWFRIRTAGSTDARSATCTVNVDDPSRVLLKRKGVEVELQKGANPIKFDPATENEIEIEPVGKPLYRVTKGDFEITTNYRYIIEVADGDEINIQANYPEFNCAVKFTVTGNGAADFITEMDVDGRPVFNWFAEDFKVKCGSEIKIKGNTNEYEVLSFTVNGQSQMFANPTTILVTEDTEMYFNVRKYASFQMTINVDDPTHVAAYRGHAANGDKFDLIAGANTVEVTRNTPIVSFVPAEGYYIATLSVNDDNYDVEDLQISPVRIGQLTDDDVITLTTDKIVRDKKAMVYVDNLAAADGFFKLKRADLSEVAGIHEGYNELAFYDRDNRFRFETGGPVEAHFYVNGVLEEPAPGGYNYTPSLADGDVVKIYFGDAPAKHNVRFNVDEELAPGVTIVADHTNQISHLEEHSMLHNSHVKITLPQNAKAVVTLDDTKLEPAAPGEYSFAAVGDHTVDIKGSTSGIASIETEGDVQTIYNLQGIAVGSTFEKLPAGVYIIGDKKVIKK